MQVGQHAILAHRDGLSVEAIILGAAPTIVAHPGPIPPGVAAAEGEGHAVDGYAFHLDQRRQHFQSHATFTLAVAAQQ